jgi:hypothetical protein
MSEYEASSLINDITLKLHIHNLKQATNFTVQRHNLKDNSHLASQEINPLFLIRLKVR